MCIIIVMFFKLSETVTVTLINYLAMKGGEFIFQEMLYFLRKYEWN